MSKPDGVDAALACLFIIAVAIGTVVLKDRVVSVFADAVVQLFDMRRYL